MDSSFIDQRINLLESCMTLLNPKNLQKIKVLKSYTDPFHKSPCCFLELSLKRTGNRLCVVPGFFLLLKLQQICTTSDSQTWPHPITKGFTDEAIMVAKTSWWSWISDKRQIFVRYVRPSKWLLFLTSWNHPRRSFEKLASKASPVQLRFQSKSVWKQGPRRFGSFHHWTGNPVFLRCFKTAKNPAQKTLSNRESCCPAKNSGVLHPFSNPKRRKRSLVWRSTTSLETNPSRPIRASWPVAWQLSPWINSRIFSRKMRGFFFFRWVFVVWLQRDVVLVMINRYMIIVIVSIFFCGTYMYSV